MFFGFRWSVKRVKFSFIGLVALAATVAQAGVDPMPNCLDKRNNGALPFMNAQVLQWRATSPEGFMTRAFVQGRFVKMSIDRPNHTRFILQLTPSPNDLIEVVYNRDFGMIPVPTAPGTMVEVCGDYITARVASPKGPASPVGAIIHWTHINPGDRDGGAHDHGWVRVGGTLTGDTFPKNRDFSRFPNAPVGDGRGLLFPQGIPGAGGVRAGGLRVLNFPGMRPLPNAGVPRITAPFPVAAGAPAYRRRPGN